MKRKQPGTLLVETIAIGDELLDGRLADTNSRFLADRLAPFSIRLRAAQVVDDDIDAIAAAVRLAAERADVVVTSGGLGPTSDDLTAEGVAKAAGCGLRLDDDAMAKIKRRFAASGFDMPDNNRRQAEVPQTATLVDNDVGVAPGYVTSIHGAQVWSFPGVPKEYHWLVDNALLPFLHKEMQQSDRRAVSVRTIRTLGMTESGLGAALEEISASHPELVLQYRTSFPENHARLLVDGVSKEAADAAADALVEKARAAIGGAVYGVGDHSLEDLVIQRLTERGETLAVAESCTGGMLGEALTTVSGASAVFAGGVISYSNAVKVGQLGVREATLEAHGAVSEETATEMAAGARDRLKTTWALSITGVAGPGGGTEDKPVGTVCFGLAGPDGAKAKRRFLPWRDREAIRKMSVAIALRYLLRATDHDAAASEGAPDKDGAA